MDIQLLKPAEVDLFLRYPIGRSLKLAKKGLLPHIILPDGEIRFNEEDVQGLLRYHNSRKETDSCST